MIVYRELPSLACDLGFSVKTLYAVSRNIQKHYHPVKIPKGNGEYRMLSVPDQLLKSIQTQIYEQILGREHISRYAAAYRPGGSTKRNAAPHVGQPVVLKLDIRKFFDHAVYPLVKEKAFPENKYSEPIRILLTMLCTYKDALPQGAPTSPVISNLILRDFDDTVGSWCKKKGIRYTRYCDDMTFSGDFVAPPVIKYVSSELRKMGFFLNHSKTVTAKYGQRQTVTGLVVNEKLSVPKAYKRKLKQELYYCRKYGVESHLARKGVTMPADRYLSVLTGRLNYILSIEPDNAFAKESMAILQGLDKSPNKTEYE